MEEKMIEFLRLVKYTEHKGVPAHYYAVYLHRCDDCEQCSLKSLPVVEWSCELHNFIAKTGWQRVLQILKDSGEGAVGVERTVDWLKRRIPCTFIAPFVVSRSIGWGISASYFFNNFYPCVRAHIRFVKKHGVMSLHEFETWLLNTSKDADTSKDAELKDVSGVISWVDSRKWYYFAVQPHENIAVSFETTDKFDELVVYIKVTDEYGEAKITYKPTILTEQILKQLQENLREGKIDKEMLKKHLENMDESRRFRFKHIAEELSKLTGDK